MPAIRDLRRRHSAAISARLNRGFDRVVVVAHDALPGKYHPYFLTEDIAAAGFILMGFALEAVSGQIVGWKHALAMGVTFLLYSLAYLKIKRSVTGVGARSALQDSLLFVFPAYVGLSWAWGQPFAPTLDALGLSILWAIGWMRLGCFLSGCCHGRPSRIGVRYPTTALRSVAGWRIYTCPPDPGRRVFPLPLIESAAVFLLFVVLWWLHGSAHAPTDGKILALAVIGYCVWRFIAEHFRGHRHRPRYLGVSEAQILAVVLTGIAVIGLIG